MCLIPVQVIREIGLSMPMFIKWDDAEFGLRAKEAGYPTVSLPGAAVWHVPWTEKDDTIDWQAYFHERNRLTSALLHSPYPHGGSLLKESMQTVVKHCVSMQYSAAEMVLLAIEDVLEGPDRMHRDLANRLGELRQLRQQYSDARTEAALSDFPKPRRAKPPRRGRAVVQPRSQIGYAKTFVTGLARQLLDVRELSRRHPEAIVPAPDLRWWRLIQFDSALVSSADGTAVSWYRRDPAKFRDLLERGVALHARLYKEWPNLVEQYRASISELTSVESWQPDFAGTSTGESSGD
jgi:galactofuranosylgalactofuranosylrhamnosyl-N-acetylglucosaminyl-diphospho-decaprenol beta-1,5/1,6-galactofuranosyltransferase